MKKLYPVAFLSLLMSYGAPAIDTDAQTLHLRWGLAKDPARLIRINSFTGVDQVPVLAKNTTVGYNLRNMDKEKGNTFLPTSVLVFRFYQINEKKDTVIMKIADANTDGKLTLKLVINGFTIQPGIVPNILSTTDLNVNLGDFRDSINFGSLPNNSSIAITLSYAAGNNGITTKLVSGKLSNQTLTKQDTAYYSMRNIDVNMRGTYRWKYAVKLQTADVNGRPLNGSGQNLNIVLSNPGQLFAVIEVNERSETDKKKVALIKVLDYTRKYQNSDGKTESRSIESADITTSNSAFQAVMKVTNVTPEPGFFTFNFAGTEQQYAELSPSKIKNKNYGIYQRYFIVDVLDVDSSATKVNFAHVPGSLRFGILNFPFKYRPQNKHSDFAGSFNFGAAVGWVVPHKGFRRASHSIIFGYSLSTAVLDSSSIRRGQSKIKSTNNYAALSLSTGYMIEYNKIQFGIFAGIDLLNRLNQSAFGWVYEGKPWFSIGIGYTIFSIQTPPSAPSSQTTQN